MRKSRYWNDIRRTKPEIEIEKRHATRFGRYWAEGTGSWTGDKGCPLWFPHAGPPPRVGAAAPRRWAAEPQGPRPYGPRPYELRLVLIDQSKAITDQLKLSNNLFTLQRLRDFRMHIFERRRHSGSLFLDKEKLTAAQFARG